MVIDRNTQQAIRNNARRVKNMQADQARERTENMLRNNYLDPADADQASTDPEKYIENLLADPEHSGRNYRK